MTHKQKSGSPVQRDLATISDSEWLELRRLYGDIILEMPEICRSLIDEVRRDRVH